MSKCELMNNLACLTLHAQGPVKYFFKFYGPMYFVTAYKHILASCVFADVGETVGGSG